MAIQDRTGESYENIIISSLEALGHKKIQAQTVSEWKEQTINTNNKNQLHILAPSKRQKKVAVEGTFIQPDIILLDPHNKNIFSIIYITHWSNKRVSKLKFWRTFDEYAQQLISINNLFLSINIVFESLQIGENPKFCKTCEDLPLDKDRKDKPIQLDGWDAGIGYALIEAFDLNLLLPQGFRDKDAIKLMLKKMIENKNHKKFKISLKNELINIKTSHTKNNLKESKTNYKIGLLHLYLFVNFSKNLGFEQDVQTWLKFLSKLPKTNVKYSEFKKIPFLNDTSNEKIIKWLELLSELYIKTGKNPVYFLDIKKFGFRNNFNYKISFNENFSTFLGYSDTLLNDLDFLDSLKYFFRYFDSSFCINEVFEDLSNPKLVYRKAKYVSDHFLNFLDDEDKLIQNVLNFAPKNSLDRMEITNHDQGWVLEMLLYLAKLNSTEDIQKRFKQNFELLGHKIKPHSPWGDFAATVIYMLQGRSLSEHWNNSKNLRTLNSKQFEKNCLITFAKCVSQAFKEKGSEAANSEEIVSNYRQSKCNRIISAAELNAFKIMANARLGDLFHFKLNLKNENEHTLPQDDLKTVRLSFFTEIINELFDARPLVTWFDGQSKDGNWLLKIQSTSDGHKTKELAGRCRASKLAWEHEGNPKDRSQWSIVPIETPKFALLIDGKWSETRKKWLYEAGWDWVGDVSEIPELRKLMNQSI